MLFTNIFNGLDSSIVSTLVFPRLYRTSRVDHSAVGNRFSLTVIQYCRFSLYLSPPLRAILTPHKTSPGYLEKFARLRMSYGGSLSCGKKRRIRRSFRRTLRWSVCVCVDFFSFFEIWSAELIEQSHQYP